jgi:uncharacterized phage protein (TIGR01671 family)
MREIKFRAWDAGATEMHYDYISSKKEYTDWGATNDPTYELHRDIILMQFTGLEDKNGRDIYEGDVVKHYHPTLLADFLADGEVVWSPKEHQYTYQGWYVKPPDKHAVLIGSSVEYEIIGNIYENSELLH